MVREPIRGMMARESTKTPMPPAQWVKLRQKSRPFGTDSTSIKIVAPVVVKPEAASNTASKKLGVTPERKKGRAPKMDTRTQVRATTAKPSRARR